MSRRHELEEVVDLHVTRQRDRIRNREWDVLLAIAVGGAAGAEARYALAEAMPHAATGFPWSTILINASGCLVIGVFMVIILELTSPHRLVRPFLATGTLGGYTTFSTFAVDAEELIIRHRPISALAYIVLTIVSCLTAVMLATLLTREVGEGIVGWRLRRLRRAQRRVRETGRNSG